MYRERSRSRWSRPLTVSSAPTTRRCYETSLTRRLVLKLTYDFPPRNVERRRLDVSSACDSLAVRRPVRQPHFGRWLERITWPGPVKTQGVRGYWIIACTTVHVSQFWYALLWHCPNCEYSKCRFAHVIVVCACGFERTAERGISIIIIKK